jgi:hypothetical protein
MTSKGMILEPLNVGTEVLCTKIVSWREREYYAVSVEVILFLYKAK